MSRHRTSHSRYSTSERKLASGPSISRINTLKLRVLGLICLLSNQAGTYVTHLYIFIRLISGRKPRVILRGSDFVAFSAKLYSKAP
jgi:hypothetical protein